MVDSTPSWLTSLFMPTSVSTSWHADAAAPSLDSAPTPLDELRGEPTQADALADRGAPAFDVPLRELELARAQGSFDGNVFESALEGEYGALRVAALGVDADGSVRASFGENGLRALAEGSLDLYLLRSEADVRAGPLQAAGALQVGIEAEGEARANLDPLRGDLEVSGEVGAFAGARAQGEATVDLGPVDASAKGNVGIGVGGELKGNLGFDDWTFGLGVGASGYLGVGGGAEASLEVDIPELAGGAVDLGKDAVALGRDATRDAAAFGQGVARAGDTALETVAGVGGDVVTGARKIVDSITPW